MTTADDYGGTTLTRMLRKVNDFRCTPAAVLLVSTMAVFADTVVYGLIVPFLPSILQDKLGMSSSANGILFGCFGVGVLVGAPVSAYISDRYHIRKWPMIIGLLGLGATSILFALSNAFWELVLARLAQGVSSGITWAIGLGMIADVYPHDSIGKAMGIAFSGFTLGYLGGPVLGGVIYDAGGVHAIAIFVAAITVVDLAFRLLLREPKEVNLAVSRQQSRASLANAQREKLLNTESNADHIEQVSADVQHENKGESSKKSEITTDSATQQCSSGMSVKSEEAGEQPEQRRTTMWDLLKDWPILACCVATITVTGASGAFEPVLPIYLRDNFGLNPTLTSVVFIALVVPNAIMGPIAGRYTDNERVLAKLAPFGRFGFMIIGSLLTAVSVAFMGLPRNLPGLVINLVFCGLLNGVAAVPIMSTMGVRVHRMGGDAYAKVYALFNIAYSVGVIIIPTILPPILNAAGFAATMGVVAAILVFGAIILSIQPTIWLVKYGRNAFVGENAKEYL